MTATTKRRPINSLTQADARKIKRGLWEGVPMPELAARHSISYRTIVAIRFGQRWHSVAWPDGAIGALPPARAGLLAEKRAAKSIKEGRNKP